MTTTLTRLSDALDSVRIDATLVLEDAAWVFVSTSGRPLPTDALREHIGRLRRTLDDLAGALDDVDAAVRR